MELITQLDEEKLIFNNVDVRIIGTFDDPWFVAKDICDILGLSNVTKTLLKLPEEWKGLKDILTPGGQQNMCIINEFGLYKLIMRSNKPVAEKFQYWVCSEVLPSLRKKGEYKMNEEYQLKLQSLKKELDDTKIEFKKLKRAHRSILLKKSVHYFMKGKCFYIFRNICEGQIRYKIGITLNINKRLMTHKVAAPYLKLEYLVFLDEYELLETILKKHYNKELNPNNSEFIADINIEDIINKTREVMKLLDCPYREETYEELSKYNETENEQINEDEPINQTSKEESNEDKKEDVKEEVIFKRCPGKIHNTEESRMLSSDNFHKNRATTDGYATYCKKCARLTRELTETYMEKISVEDFDKNVYKWCPGEFHKTPTDHIVIRSQFHANKSAIDKLSAYCKQCSCSYKYGENRNKRGTPKKPPENINKDLHKWCYICENILDRNKFHKNKANSDGLASGCIECRKLNRK
jgi:prophage antirepressor-like protein